MQTEDGDWYDVDDVCHTPEGIYPNNDCQRLDHEYEGYDYAHDNNAIEVNGEWYHADDPDAVEDEDEDEDEAEMPHPSTFTTPTNLTSIYGS
jgi:hypothetical protein